MTPHFLIVVPTLNSFTLLPRLVSSLQNQTWTKWSLVFIDGPSSIDHRIWLDRCCSEDPRFSWIEQDYDDPGIFGAMNRGFDLAEPEDWLIFWGSDDWAASPFVLAEVVDALQLTSPKDVPPDLLVCRGRYVDAVSDNLARTSLFLPAGLISRAAYRRALFLGSTPPHQATFLGPGARKSLGRFAPGFRLSADLDYFLQLSQLTRLQVCCLDLELVHMASGGISGLQTRRRLHEVRLAYRRLFGCNWWFPFILRYVRRLLSLL